MSDLSTITQQIEKLEEAKDLIAQASELIKSVARAVQGLPTSYNMSGNMHSYVINHLTDGVDSISEKLDGYVDELHDVGLQEMQDEEDDDCVYKPGVQVDMTLRVSNWSGAESKYIELSRVYRLTIKSVEKRDDDVFLTFEQNEYGIETSISVNAESVEQIRVINE